MASVLQNRLAKEMPLMTDPTVIYAAMLENRYRGTIYQSDLKRDSAYNTYRHAGCRRDRSAAREPPRCKRPCIPQTANFCISWPIRQQPATRGSRRRSRNMNEM